MPAGVIQRSLRVTALVLAVFLAACGPNRENLRKQAEGTRRLGEVYLQEGSHSRALQTFFEAESVFAEDAKLQTDIGLAYMGRGKLDLAVERFERALSIDPGFSEAKNSLGVAYLRMKDWDTAIAYFDTLKDDILYAHPHFPLFNLGYAHYQKGDYARAERYFKEALEQNAEFVDALQWLGRTYLKTGSAEKAVIRLEKAVELLPASQILQFDLASAYLQEGNRDRAAATLRKVVAIDPETPLAIQSRRLLKNLAD